MPDIKVPLKKPIPSHGGLATEVVLKEPTGADYFDLGRPTTLVRTQHGMALVENDQVIKAYIEKCIIKPDPLLVIGNLSIRDAMAVKDAVLSFFEDATATPSKPSVTTSSSLNESSPPTPSAE